jgi:hypothetical protein
VAVTSASTSVVGKQWHTHVCRRLARRSMRCSSGRQAAGSSGDHRATQRSTRWCGSRAWMTKARFGGRLEVQREREAARHAWGCGQRSWWEGSSRPCPLVLLAKTTAAAHKSERRVSGSFSPVDTLLTSRSQWGVPAALPKSCGRVDVNSGGGPGSDEDRRVELPICAA